MSISMWPCNCKDKMNAGGIKRCKKCGVTQPSYSTNGSEILVTRSAEVPTKTKAKRPKPRQVTGKPPAAHAPGSNDFLQSTFSSRDDA